jgi:sugar/nucleoside kinase (ribokinase family)
MYPITTLTPIDYLLIGHITVDLAPDGEKLGGSTYAALAARALGLRVGIVTSWGGEIPLGPLQDIPIANVPAERSTVFENIDTPQGRVQTIHHVASRLEYYHIPEPWRNASIVHLGPFAQEVGPSLVRNFPSSLIGVTPQGWLREWDSEGHVYVSEWPEATFVLQQVGAAVVGIEDVDGDEDRIDEMALACRVLAVTEGAEGVRIYWNGDVRRFRPPQVDVVDTVGAGDIFATAFFARLYATRDPWEAARFATQLSAISVTRLGIASVPTEEEVNNCSIEVF